jgi:hypothetical protein
MNIQRARAEVRKLVGEIRVEATEETIELGLRNPLIKPWHGLPADRSKKMW